MEPAIARMISCAKQQINLYNATHKSCLNNGDEKMGTVTFINTEQYRLQPVPEVGKEYHIFDDGKIKPSRHYMATILTVIPFNELIDSELLQGWECDKLDCYWLYAETTDYFIKASATCTDMPLYFVRATDGGWFSLGWWGARLDIDGSLYKQMIELSGKE